MNHATTGTIHVAGDFHNHTVFSHGKGSIEDNVLVALSKNIQVMAISDHGPGHMGFGIKKSRYFEMRRIIDELNVKYPQIEILLGLEANVMNVDGDLDVDQDMLEIADVLLAGYHFGSSPVKLFRDLSFHVSNIVSKKSAWHFRKAYKNNTKAVINAIKRYPLMAITHPGAKGPVDIAAIAAVAAENGTALEINNHHGHLTYDEILQAKSSGVKFIISSDAHVPKDIGVFDSAVERAIKAGLTDKDIINSAVNLADNQYKRISSFRKTAGGPL